MTTYADTLTDVLKAASWHERRASWLLAAALSCLVACGASEANAPTQGVQTVPAISSTAGTPGTVSMPASSPGGSMPAGVAPASMGAPPVPSGAGSAPPMSPPPPPSDPNAGMTAPPPDPAMMPAQGSSDPMPSPGCQSGSMMPGRSTVSVQSGGNMRSSIQYVPASYDGKKPLPVVVDLHGYSQTGAGAEGGSGFRGLADSENFIYLAPNGMGNRWEAIDDDDTMFIRALLTDVGAKGCVDLRRIYSTGCSNGGGLTFLLMCTAEDVFAAVAPMCGTSFVDLETDCMMDRPVSNMLVIGRSDTLNCWEGTTQSLMPGSQPGRTVNVPCAKFVQKVLTEKYNCKGEIQTSDICETVGECDGGTEVAICGTNTGHVVYSPTVARRAWDFLKRFYKP